MAASTNDPYMTVEEAIRLQSKLNIGMKIMEDAGHINVASGFGKLDCALDWIKKRRRVWVTRMSNSLILSIESSCDDSSITITEIETNKLIYHKKISQEIQHSVYGGVVPELAARLHVEALPKILEECKDYFPF